MKTINDINQLILKKVVEILFVASFVFFSVYLWMDSEKQNMFATAAAYSNSNYTSLSIENPIDYSMYPMSDEYAISHLDPCNIKVMNDTLTAENYTLYLKIDKISTLNYHYLHIAIDDNVYNLENLISKEENNNYYFILDKNSIVGATKNYEVKLWLNEIAGNDMQNKQLIMSFEIANEVTKM